MEREKKKTSRYTYNELKGEKRMGRGKKMKQVRFLSIIGIMILTFFMSIGFTSERSIAEEGTKKITIVHTNDIHAQIDDMAKLAAYNQTEKESSDVFFYVDAGDIFSGNPVVDMNKGVPMIDLLNQVDLDLIGIGNHEFDYGVDELNARISEADFTFLSANTEVGDSGLTAPEPYTIIEKEGLRIGFLTLTQAPPATAPKNVEGMTFHPYVETIEKYKDLREEENLDVLIAVNHIGLEEDRKLAGEFEGVFDVIIGGHSHTTLNNADIVNGTPIVQTGSHLNNIGNITLTVDSNKDVTDFDWKNQPVDQLTDVDENVQQSIDDYNAEMEEMLGEVIGETTGLSQSGKQARDVPLGNFWTDAMRSHVGADIAFTNNGGIRAPIAAGDLTYGDIYLIEPFANEIMEIDMTGAAIRDVLEYSFIRDNRNQIDLQASGIHYVIYKDAFGQFDRVEATINGEPMEDDKVYKAAVPDYIGSGGSGYNFVGDIITSSSGLMTDAMINYAKELVEEKGIIDVQSEGRIEIKQDVIDNLSVADAIANNEGRASVTGYIVGHVVSQNNFNLEAPFANDQNLLLADDPNETDPANMLPVQLTTEFRDQFGLQSNPDRIGDKIIITGTLEDYYTHPGLKSPERIELYDAISIAEARQLDVGETATVEGVVLVDSGAWGAESFYMHDGTGGISVYQFDYNVQEGDYIRLSGMIDEFNGEVQFNPVSSIDVLDTEQPLPDPINLSLDELDPTYIGELVEVKSATITNLEEVDDFGTFEFQAEVDGETVHVRVDSRTGLAFDEFTFADDDVVDITGVVGIYNETIQIKPRKTEDIVLAIEEEDPEEPEKPEEPETPEEPGEPDLEDPDLEEPDTPEEPGNGDDGAETDGENGEGGPTESDENGGDGGSLPNTATNTWNFIAIGAMLLVLGSSVLFIVHRRRRVHES